MAHKQTCMLACMHTHRSKKKDGNLGIMDMNVHKAPEIQHISALDEEKATINNLSKKENGGKQKHINPSDGT